MALYIALWSDKDAIPMGQVRLHAEISRLRSPPCPIRTVEDAIACLRAHRESQALSQAEANDIANLTGGHFSKYECGTRTPDLKGFLWLAEVLGLDVVLVPHAGTRRVTGAKRPTVQRQQRFLFRWTWPDGQARAKPPPHVGARVAWAVEGIGQERDRLASR